MSERQALWAGRGREQEEREGMQGLGVGSLVDEKNKKNAQGEGMPNGH